jgi:3,4-dihydroxy 2-butanone 4-phosphate synthase/GTP cyclohydrolase II
MNKHEAVLQAIQDLKDGKIIVVLDEENRENEGDFVVAAQYTTWQHIQFMSAIGRGLICAPLTQAIASKLALPFMVDKNTSHHQTAFTISVDGFNTTTGISDIERAHTIQALANPSSVAKDFKRPGHIFPLIAKQGGLMEREGHTEAAVDLMQLAGLKPVAVICEMLGEKGKMARKPDLKKMAKKYALTMIEIKDIIAYQKEKTHG